MHPKRSWISQWSSEPASQLQSSRFEVFDFSALRLPASLPKTNILCFGDPFGSIMVPQLTTLNLQLNILHLHPKRSWISQWSSEHIFWGSIIPIKKLSFCSHGEMDITIDFGSIFEGSNPSGSTINPL